MIYKISYKVLTLFHLSIFCIIICVVYNNVSYANISPFFQHKSVVITQEDIQKNNNTIEDIIKNVSTSHMQINNTITFAVKFLMWAGGIFITIISSICGIIVWFIIKYSKTVMKNTVKSLIDDETHIIKNSLQKTAVRAMENKLEEGNYLNIIRQDILKKVDGEITQRIQDNNNIHLKINNCIYGLQQLQKQCHNTEIKKDIEYLSHCIPFILVDTRGRVEYIDSYIESLNDNLQSENNNINKMYNIIKMDILFIINCIKTNPQYGIDDVHFYDDIIDNLQVKS